MSRASAALTKLITNVDLFHRFLHGSDTVTVVTEGGIVPSMAKALKDYVVAPFANFGINNDDTKGAALVGYDGGTVQDVLDNAKPMANYTALRNYSGRATAIRITQTGLAGFFYRDDADTTSTDNGGTIIVASNGKRWKRQFDGTVVVTWFGAKGDNVTDDTTAVRAAINAAIVRVFFPQGKYLLTSTLRLRDGLQLIGAGSRQDQNTSLRFAKNDGTHCFDSDSTLYLSAVRIEGMEIVNTINTAGTIGSGNAFSLFGVTNNCVFRDLLIRNFGGSAFSIGKQTTVTTDLTACSNVLFEQVFVVSCGGYSFDINGYTNATWLMCDLNSCATGFWRFQGGVSNQCMINVIGAWVEGTRSWSALTVFDMVNTNGQVLNLIGGNYTNSVAGTSRIVKSTTTSCRLNTYGITGFGWTYLHEDTVTGMNETLSAPTNRLNSLITPTITIEGSGPISELYEMLAGTVDQRRFRWGISSGQLVLSARSDNGTSLRNLVFINHNTGLFTPGADNAYGMGSSTARWKDVYSGNFRPGTGGPVWTSGAGTPEGAVTAAVGSLFTRTDGTGDSTLYVKESGSGSTGWAVSGREKVADYTALRAYTGGATSLLVTQTGITGQFYRDDADTTSTDNGGTVIVDAGGKRWKRLFAGDVNVRWFGAKADGTTDDTAAIDAACNYVNSLPNGGTVLFPPGAAAYVFKRAQVGSQRGIYLRNNVRISAYGATFEMKDNASFFTVQPATIERLDISSDVALNDYTINVSSAGTLAVGDRVFVRLGTSAYDAAEPAYWYWAGVTAIVGLAVTLDRPATGAMTVASTVNTNRQLVKVSDVSNVVVEGAFFTCLLAAASAQVEACVNAQYVHGLTVRNCRALNSGAGLLIAQYCEDVDFLDCSAPYGIRAENTSKGRFASFAECDGVRGNNLLVRNFQSAVAAIVVEAASTNVQFNNVNVDVDGTGGTGGRRYAFSLLGQGPIQVNGLSIRGKNVYPSTSSQAWGISRLRNVSVFAQYTLSGGAGPTLDDLVLNGVPYTRQTVTVRVALPVNGSKVVDLPSGRVIRSKLLASRIAGMTGLYLRRDSTNTNNGVNLVPAGANASAASAYDYVDTNSNARNFNDDKQLYITCDATMTASNYVYLQLEMLVRDDYVDDVGTSLLTYIDA